MNKLNDILPKKYIDFLTKKVITIDHKNLFEGKDCYFNIVKFYNLTDSDFIIDINNKYKGRIDNNMSIIADADNGDYLLINQKGNIFFWNHEENDLGINEKANTPIKVSNKIEDFLKKLKSQSNFDLEPEVKSVKLSDDFKTLFKDYL